MLIVDDPHRQMKHLPVKSIEQYFLCYRITRLTMLYNFFCFQRYLFVLVFIINPNVSMQVA